MEKLPIYQNIPSDYYNNIYNQFLNTNVEVNIKNFLTFLKQNYPNGILLPNYGTSK